MEVTPTAQSALLDPQDRARSDARNLLARSQGTRINPIAALQGREPDPKSAVAEESSPLDTLFDTVVDTVNPLQHIPGVSSAYRAATDDAINPVASMAGGFLFGGPVGLMAGAASSFLEMITGKSVAQHAMALFGGETDQGKTGAVETAYVSGDGSPMLQVDKGLSLQQYQAFANAAADTNSGTGASAQEAARLSNTWTANALHQATSAYQTQQNSHAINQGRTNRFI